MDGIDLAQPLQKALSVCHNCKQRKKKCDKSLPKCSSCTRFRRLCNYPDSSYNNAPELLIGNQHTHNTNLAPSLSKPGLRTVNTVSQKTSFPPVYFLDFDLFKVNLTELPCVHSISVPPEIQCLVSTIADRRDIASTYFRDLHHCLPFISKKTCFDKFLNPSMQSRVDVSLLFACMRLIQTPPKEGNARTTEYLALKVAFLEAELAGIITLQLLQAWILTAFYEMGHAIYPSAYLSIGSCARYATALGLHAHESFDTHMPYMEIEEKRRTWWVIVILDRFVSIGCPERPLATRDLQGNDPLPIDDTAWDQGDYEYVKSLTLSLPPSPTMGRLGLLCLASNLLGLVLKQISTKTTDDQKFHTEERAVLDRALLALNNISMDEGSSRDTGVCCPKAVCYSARFLLNSRSVDANRADVDDLRVARAVRIGVSECLRGLSRMYLTGPLPSVATPFNIDPLYRAASTFAQVYIENDSQESYEALIDLKATLKRINERWNIAGAYIDLLEELEARCASHWKMMQNYVPVS